MPECDTPSELKGLWWGVIEKGQCLEGNRQYFGDYRNTSYSETVRVLTDYGYENQNVHFENKSYNDPDIGEQDYECKNEYEDYENTSYEKALLLEPLYVQGNMYGYFDSNQNHLPVYAVPFIFGTPGNFILLIIIICNKDMRTLPNMYILNLSISDIIYLMVFFF